MRQLLYLLVAIFHIGNAYKSEYCKSYLPSAYEILNIE
jgi:hypothetical protein